MTARSAWSPPTSRSAPSSNATERPAAPPPRRLLSLCEEEGSRYPAADFSGSHGIIGGIDAGAPESVLALDGGSIADGMRAVGLDPARCAAARRDDISCVIELRI